MTDVPFDQAVKDADELIKRGANVYQKFTCSHCGARQTICEPNVFYTSATCEECEGTTDISECGYMVIMGISV